MWKSRFEYWQYPNTEYAWRYLNGSENVAIISYKTYPHPKAIERAINHFRSRMLNQLRHPPLKFQEIEFEKHTAVRGGGFEFWRYPDGTYSWRFIGGNGNIVAMSYRTYPSVQALKESVKRLIQGIGRGFAFKKETVVEISIANR